jgi:hypothetical protein
LFLIEMDKVVPWAGMIALIEPHYPKCEGGPPVYPLMVMLYSLDAELVRLQRSSNGGGVVRDG